QVVIDSPNPKVLAELVIFAEVGIGPEQEPADDRLVIDDGNGKLGTGAVSLDDAHKSEVLECFLGGGNTFVIGDELPRLTLQLVIDVDLQAIERLERLLVEKSQSHRSGHRGELQAAIAQSCAARVQSIFLIAAMETTAAHPLPRRIDDLQERPRQ